MILQITVIWMKANPSQGVSTICLGGSNDVGWWFPMAIFVGPNSLLDI